jgi:peptidyl-prolyl cis-trans isomerase D
MLQFLRTHSSSWIAKILLGLLILSFGLFWGISEFFRSKDTSHIVASVGKIDVSKAQLQNAVQEDLKRLNAELKSKSISFKQALQLGIVNQVLDRLINEILIDLFIRDSKLTATDRLIATSINLDPLFKNAQGQFDREKFDMILRANNLTERAFFQSRRHAFTRTQLLSGIGTGGYVPASLALGTFKALNEKRSFKVLKFDPTQMKLTGNPTPETLRAYYDAHKSDYVIPGKRKFSLILLSPSALSYKYSFTEREIKEAYQQQSETFLTPERRTFVFAKAANPEEARQYQSLLNSGKGTPPANTFSLENVAQTELNKSLARVVFASPEKKASDPVKLGNDYIVVYVKSIKQSQVPPFSQVRAQVEQELRRQKALEEIANLSQKIEEKINAGMSLGEITKSLRLSLIQNTLQEGGKISDADKKSILFSEEILKDIYSLPEGGETPITDLPDGVAYILKVDQVLPPKSISFEEAKDKITAKCQQEERSKLAASLAAKALDDLQQGKAPEALQGAGATLDQIKSVSLMELPKNLKIPAFILAKGFKGKQKEPILVSSVTPLTPTYILISTEITPVSVEKNIGFYKAFKEGLAVALQQDIYLQFFMALKDKYGVKVHQAAIDSLAE